MCAYIYIYLYIYIYIYYIIHALMEVWVTDFWIKQTGLGFMHFVPYLTLRMFCKLSDLCFLIYSTIAKIHLENLLWGLEIANNDYRSTWHPTGSLGFCKHLKLELTKITTEACLLIRHDCKGFANLILLTTICCCCC